MIVTVTPNTGIDQTLLVPEFKLNRTIRSVQSVIGMGGKATDAAWILGHWGVPNLALGFAAGTNGERMAQMLRERGTEVDFVLRCFGDRYPGKRGSIRFVRGCTLLDTVVAVEGGQCSGSWRWGIGRHGGSSIPERAG